MKLQELGRQRAGQLLIWALQPRTYIFGFTGYKTPKGLRGAVQEWYSEMNSPGSILAPYLPRLIVSEGAVGLSADNWVTLPPPEDPAMAAVMQFISSGQRFGMLVVHLAHAVSERLGTMHASEGVRYGYEEYFPWQDYLARGASQPSPCILLPKNWGG